MNEKEQIIEAWNILNDLEGSIKCGCKIEQDEITDLRCLYYKMKALCKAIDESKKY